MKGSDKKKFRQNVKKVFFDNSDESDCLLDAFLPQKEEMTMSKVYTFGGESVLIYTVGKDPLFFELDKAKTLFPTVYMMWKCPQIVGGERLPVMTTIGGVVPKLQNGADLMMPGVVTDPSKKGKWAFCEGRLNKGDPMCVNLAENKGGIAVGTAARDSEDMYMSAGRGKAVIVLHCIGDKLWESGTKEAMPQLGPVEILAAAASQSTLEGAESDEDEEKPPEGENQSESDHSSQEEGSEQSDTEKDIAEKVERISISEAAEKADEQIEEEEEDPRSPEEKMDEIIENAFLQALKTNAKKMELPVLTSGFFRQYMVPASNSDLDLKKSSYKKLGKFLAKMQAEKIIVIKEPKKGVEVIDSVDFNHDRLTSFRTVKIEPKESSTEGGSGASKKKTPPTVIELNLVTAAVVNFFKEFGVTKGKGLTSVEVRELVKEYVKREGLQNKEDPSVINLDPLLAEVVLVKGENTVYTIRWDKVTSRITSKMTRGYSIDFHDGRSPEAFKGKLEPIEFLLASRSGNKKVTLIHNLDIYGIDLQEFAHKCQVGVAASTTVHEATNKKRAGGGPVMEVLVQGNQVAFASDLLLNHYQLPRKYLRGLELATKAKKGKK